MELMLTCEYCLLDSPEGSPHCVHCGGRRTRNFGKVTGTREALRSAFGLLNVQDWAVQGTDISKWNGIVNFLIMRLKCQTVIIRGGFSIYRDSKLEANRSGAQAADMAWGLYWFFRVGEPMKAQVDAFFKVYQEGHGQILPMFDFEFTAVGITETTSWIKGALEYWTALTGKKPGIYTSPGWWNANVARNTWAKNYFLWDAHWTTATSPIVPYDWQTATQPWGEWQRSADNNGRGEEYGCTEGDPDIDLNVWVYSVSAFNETFGTHILPIGDVPPEPEPDKLLTMRVIRPILNIRAGPGTGFADLGDLHEGDIVTVSDVAGSDAWACIEPGRWACIRQGSTQYLVKE